MRVGVLGGHPSPGTPLSLCRTCAPGHAALLQQVIHPDLQVFGELVRVALLLVADLALAIDSVRI